MLVLSIGRVECYDFCPRTLICMIFLCNVPGRTIGSVLFRNSVIGSSENIGISLYEGGTGRA